MVNKLFPEDSNDFGILSLTAYAPRYVVGTYTSSGYNYYTIQNETIIEGQTFNGRSNDFNMSFFNFEIRISKSDGSNVRYDARVSYTNEDNYPHYFIYSIPSSIFSEGNYQIFGENFTNSVKFYCYYDPRSPV